MSGSLWFGFEMGSGCLVVTPFLFCHGAGVGMSCFCITMQGFDIYGVGLTTVDSIFGLVVDFMVFSNNFCGMKITERVVLFEAR